MKKTFVILIIYIFYGCNNHEIKKDKTTSSLDEKVTENISDNYFETISYDLDISVRFVPLISVG